MTSPFSPPPPLIFGPRKVYPLTRKNRVPPQRYIMRDKLVSPPESSIVIGDITFTVLSYKHNPPGFGGRDRIKFSSESSTLPRTEYYAYRSNSEIGLWRLCIENRGGLLEKGYDYVQSSLIHFELQKFFNKFPNTETDAEKEEAPCHYSDANSDDIYRHLYGRDRVTPLENLPKDYTQNIESISKSELNIIADLVRKKYTYESLTLIYPNYSVIMEDGYTNMLDCSGNIYSCNFTDGTQLYFIKFSITITYTDTRPPLHKEGYGPLLMTPPGTTITKFGTYSNYVFTSKYIHKLFDYSEQCDYQNNLGKDGRTMSDFDCDYIYIGDRYKAVYPFKHFKVHEDGSLYYDGDGSVASGGAGAASGGARKRGRQTLRKKKRKHTRNLKTRYYKN